MKRYPKKKVLLVEKEKEVAQHQSSRNSGVIHAGIYYAPGSYKARLCVEGAKEMMNYCENKKIKYEKCGKVIVAVNEEEQNKLEKIFENGKINNVQGIRLINKKQLLEIEPLCEGGISAIHSPNTGTIFYLLKKKVKFKYFCSKKKKKKESLIFFKFQNLTKTR